MSTVEEKQLYSIINTKCNKRFSEKAYINLECLNIDKTGRDNWGEFCDIFVSTDKYNVSLQLKKITVQDLSHYHSARNKAIKQTVNDFGGILRGNIRTKKTHKPILVDTTKKFIGITVLLPCKLDGNTVNMEGGYIKVTSRAKPSTEQPIEYNVYDIMFSGILSLLSMFNSITDIIEHLIKVNNIYYEIPIDSVIASLNTEYDNTHIKVVFVDKKETTLKIDKESIKEDTHNTGIFEISGKLKDECIKLLKYPFSIDGIQDILINCAAVNIVKLFRITHDLNKYIMYCIYNTMVFEIKINENMNWGE